MKSNALRINPADNVVIALKSLKKGELVIVDTSYMFQTTEDIQAGHKIALQPINNGDKVYRYGEPILEAVHAIKPGEWVHVHNTRPSTGDLTA
jgi:hypothetical protein